MMESLESYFTFDTLVELLVKNLYYTKFQVNLIQRLKKKKWRRNPFSLKSLEIEKKEKRKKNLNSTIGLPCKKRETRFVPSSSRIL